MPLRLWQSWRAKRRLLAPCLSLKPRQFYARELRYPELESALRNGPEIEPYSGLAEIWDAHASQQLPDYPSYLAYVARRRNIPLRSVLDLACGTGILTARLAHEVPEVIGLDSNESMLKIARCRKDVHGRVEFVLGDFRDFNLARKFDAVTCASNSLNYVADSRDLAAVFRSVASHLQPGGLFLFDTITELGMRMLSGLYFHADVNGTRFAIRFRYDATDRACKDQGVLAQGVETHLRIPLDPADVEVAARGTGLSIEDYFCNALIPWSWRPGASLFFVMAKK